MTLATPPWTAAYAEPVWLGPLFLLGFILLIVWHSTGPWTERGKRNAAASRRYWGEIREQRRKEGWKGKGETSDSPDHSKLQPLIETTPSRRVGVYGRGNPLWGTPMAERQVRLEHREGTSHYGVVGDLDAAASDSLRRALQRALGSVNGRLDLDLSAVEFIDSSCVEVLLSMEQDLRERGALLSVVAASDDVRMVLELADVDQRLGLR